MDVFGNMFPLLIFSWTHFLLGKAVKTSFDEIHTSAARTSLFQNGVHDTYTYLNEDALISSG
jgi:hypothetical protein